VVPWSGGSRVIHVPAGPADHVPKEELLPYMGEFTRFLVQHCRRHGPYDLVHANFFLSALVAADLKRALGTPFVVTFHALGKVRRRYQGDADAFPAERLAIEERVVAEADAVVAECPQDREDLVSLYGAEPSRLRLIPCGFDPEELGPLDKSQARAALGLGARENIVLQLGRMVPRKGVDNVIRGLARLWRSHGIPARLLIVGGESREPDPAVTPEIGRLRRIARDEGVAEAVTFVGARGRNEIRPFFAAADVFVTTPWYEPFGITPVEAMACGTPVVGAAVGGIKYTVRHGETGLLVPPRDPEAVAEALAWLLRDPDLRDAMGRRAVRRAVGQFTWARVACLTAELYRDVLRAPARRVPAPAVQPAVDPARTVP
jgi:glycosyltransferase involved in cell wall biosynthesis